MHQKILGTSTMIYEVLKGVSTESDEVTKFLNSQIAGNSSEYLDWLWPSEVNDALSTAIVSVISGEMSSQDAAQYVQDAYIKGVRGKGLYICMVGKLDTGAVGRSDTDKNS